ncbi:MAG: HAMP domain-containing sensor histidine kinase [Microthrixaceae bacterium]
MRRPGFNPFGSLSLRARIIAAFTTGIIVIAALVAMSAVALTRSNLLDQREHTAQIRVRTNGALMADSLEGVDLNDVDAQSLMGSFSASGKPSALLFDPTSRGPARSISLDPRFGTSVLPEALVRAVIDREQPSLMRFSSRGQVLLAAGVPLGGHRGGYFEIVDLDDIADTIRKLTFRLLLATIAASVPGALLGAWSSRRVLRPLAEVSQVAETIALGRFDARLADAGWADDPDLGRFVHSFNSMADAVSDRIERDARFASDVSHELRSPLMTFNASLEVLRNARDEMPERAQLALDLLSEDMERFTQLVEDLLEISRFDAGAVRLDLGAVLLVETIRMATRSLSGESITVDAAADVDDLVILVDKRRLMRILANFIDNARKYAGGTTRIEVTTVPASSQEAAGDDEVLHEDADHRDRVRIVVEDSGPGVPEELRKRIFERFSRGVQGGSRSSATGVGLGLALAAEHARLHGGDVWVEPRTDGVSGARFVVELPVVEPDNEEHGETLVEVTT